MTDKKFGKCLSLCAIFTTLILWCGIAACQQPTLEKFNMSDAARYQELIDKFSSDEFINEQLALADKYTTVFCSPEKLDYLMNAGTRASDKQRAFNNYELYSFGLLFSRPIGLYNKDLMKSGFLAADLAVEWFLFRMTAGCLSRSVLSAMLSNRTQYIELLQTLLARKTMNDETASILLELQKISPYRTTLFVGHVSPATIRRAIAPMCGLTALTLASRSMQSSLLLNRPFDLSTWWNGSASAEPEGVFDLFEKNRFFTLPSDALRGNISGVCNDVFRSFNLLPLWTESPYVTWGTQMAYVMLYFNWSASQLFLPAWSAWLCQTAPIMLTLLVAHQKADGNKEEQDRLEDCLQKYIKRGHTVQPLVWLKHKVINYALWQTVVNCMLALPAWIKIGQALYPLVKTMFNDKGSVDAV